MVQVRKRNKTFSWNIERGARCPPFPHADCSTLTTFGGHHVTDVLSNSGCATSRLIRDTCNAVPLNGRIAWEMSAYSTNASGKVFRCSRLMLLDKTPTLNLLQCHLCKLQRISLTSALDNKTSCLHCAAYIHAQTKTFIEQLSDHVKPGPLKRRGRNRVNRVIRYSKLDFPIEEMESTRWTLNLYPWQSRLRSKLLWWRCSYIKHFLRVCSTRKERWEI
jgi:hypothetical protein